MSLRDKIVNEYQMTVLAAPVSTELKRALKYHERVPLFINKLHREISDCRVKLTDLQIAELTRSLTNWFLINMERMATERVLSDAEKQRIMKEASDKIEKEKIATAVANNESVTFDGEEFKVNGINKR